MHLAPPTQALCEKSLKKPPCAAAHGGWGFDGRRDNDARTVADHTSLYI
ncbi:hypothetical protein BSE24067_04937 [Burkholderia seminalis]|nr:hypothetical protein BSE24067_04937 [Burkholderia seminalis]